MTRNEKDQLLELSRELLDMIFPNRESSPSNEDTEASFEKHESELKLFAVNQECTLKRKQDNVNNNSISFLGHTHGEAAKLENFLSCYLTLFKKFMGREDENISIDLKSSVEIVMKKLRQPLKNPSLPCKINK